MEINKLKYFYEVAKIQHVTKAAENIHIAQPALTQAIKSLESELGVSLFYKDGRNVKLTEYGLFLKGKLDELLPEIDEIPSEILKIKKQMNNRIKLNILAASNLVINCVVAYREINPEVVIDFEQNELKNGCDITIYTNGVNQNGEKNFIERCVKEERIFLAVPSDSEFARKNTVDLADLKNEKFVMLSGSRMFRSVCDKLCACVGFIPKILFESDSPNAVQNIISTGRGIAFWPEYSWGKIKNNRVKFLEIINPVCQRELFFELNTSSVNSQYAKDFFNFLVKKCK